MKEFIRDWNYREKLAITYIDNTGNESIFEANQHELINQIINIVNDYCNQNITLTNRQIYYQLVAKDIIPNADEIYKRICKIITDSKYAGLIDWDAIEDRGRTPLKHPEWENVKELIESAIYAYRLPRWKDQKYYVELYCEKQAMESIIKPIADKYHIYFGVNKGYSSSSTIYDLSKRIKNKIIEGKKTIILYLGDHDPSGLDMIRDINDRIREFITVDMELYADEFNVEQLALNMEQINEYNPPPNPAKIKDPRAKWYIKKYGNKSWELDALEPRVLIDIAERGILKYLNKRKYNEWIRREEKEKKELIKFGNKLIANKKR